jgi:histidine ammonia-lyase
MLTPIRLDGHSLSFTELIHVARQHHPVVLADPARARMAQSHQWVDDIVTRGDPVYGINTGFGIFADRRISTADTQHLQRNLILSHAVGVGDPFPPEVTRAAMLIRANTLALGHSGARPEIVDTLIAMLNAGVTPIVPSLGSLGSSGDLAPLSHLALVLTTDAADRAEDSGQAWFQGRRLTGQAAMTAAGLGRLILGAKEALALTNGATFSAALAALTLADTEILLDTADVALALSLEALLGVSAAFDNRLHAARGHAGQQAVAAHIRQLIDGSTLIDSAGRVQDAYSLRCAPQVVGPARDTLEFARQTILREMNAATDNPLFFEGRALSGGNFHGEAVGMVMDFLGIALAEVGAIAERRIARLVDERLNGGLPPMLVGAPEAAGLHSGLMMPHYTAAALVLENQTLAAPDSIRSLPTSANQEDHNANAANAARHARQIADNVAHILAVEVLVATQAVDLRLRANPGARLGAGTARAHQTIRTHVPVIEHDQRYSDILDTLTVLIRDGAFANLG